MYRGVVVLVTVTIFRILLRSYSVTHVWPWPLSLSIDHQVSLPREEKEPLSLFRINVLLLSYWILLSNRNPPWIWYVVHLEPPGTSSTRTLVRVNGPLPFRESGKKSVDRYQQSVRTNRWVWSCTLRDINSLLTYYLLTLVSKYITSFSHSTLQNTNLLLSFEISLIYILPINPRSSGWVNKLVSTEVPPVGIRNTDVR